MGLEISWEIAENTPMVIEAYRKQALAIGYTGDSILNSLMDTLMMALGFLFASRAPAWVRVAAGIGMEVLAAIVIRDGLVLNILNFLYPIPFIQRWQAGYALTATFLPLPLFASPAYKAAMKLAFRHILLAALLLRAFVPLGWMPGVAQLGEAAFIICAADGTLQHGTPGKNDGTKPSQPCAFGTALQSMDVPQAASIVPPSTTALVIASVIAPTAPALGAARTPQSPRAPPLKA